LARDPRIAANLTIARPIPHAGNVVKSASRALEILELFQEVQRPLSIAELAASLGYPFSSAAALVNSMARDGHLRTVGRPRRFMPTLRVAALGAWVDRHHGGGSMLGAMERLHRATGHTVVLHGRNGLFSQFLHVIENPNRAVDWHVRTGMVVPLTRAGSGAALLAGLADAEIARIVRRCNAEAACVEDQKPLPEFMDKVMRVRRDGHVFALDAGVPGAAYIGMATQSGARDVLVLGLGGLAPDMTAQHRDLVRLLGDAVTHVASSCPD
jgi:DNA-binding IclR family transcriptional regulator